MIIKNYKSTLSLSNYNLGNIHTFYIHNLNLESLTNANEETVSRYSSTLNEFLNDNSCLYDNGKYLNLIRVVGIVVDKYKSNDEMGVDTITVMFKTDDNRYIINKYVVNSHDVFTNNKEFVIPSAVIRTAVEG